jgi:hypothetical protein
MILNFARTGNQGLSLLVMKKAAKDLNLVLLVTVGKNNNFTHYFIKLNPVRRPSALRVLSVPSIIKDSLIRG